MRVSGDGGSIINMSSVAGLKGSAMLAGYCATKGGVRLFSKAIAMECANAEGRNPGELRTPRAYRNADLADGWKSKP